MEYWSVGVLAEGQPFFFQHSNTPSRQYSKIKILKNPIGDQKNGFI
jgi:hypothetical protein